MSDAFDEHRAWWMRWFDMHASALVLYARQWLDAVDPAAADDVVQDLFVRLLSGRGSATPPADRASWFYRCVRNAAIDAARAQSRRRRRERRAARDAPAWFEPEPDDRLDAAAATAALKDLSLVQREIILLRIWSGLTFAEIAEITGIATSSVHDHYQRGLSALRDAIASPRLTEVP